MLWLFSCLRQGKAPSSAQAFQLLQDLACSISLLTWTAEFLLLPGCLWAVPWCSGGFVLCFRRTMVRPLSSLLQCVTATRTGFVPSC